MKLRWFDVDAEFRCQCGRAECDAPTGPHRLLGLYLDRVREMYGQPLVVTSGNRCAVHNANEGGGAVSEHVWPDGCLGADVRCGGSRDRARLLDAIRQAGVTRVGLYAAHVHIGIGDFVAPASFPPIVAWLGGYKAKA